MPHADGVFLRHTVHGVNFTDSVAVLGGSRSGTAILFHLRWASCCPSRRTRFGPAAVPPDCRSSRSLRGPTVVQRAFIGARLQVMEFSSSSNGSNHHYAVAGKPVSWIADMDLCHGGEGQQGNQATFRFHWSLRGCGTVADKNDFGRRHVHGG